MSIVTIILATIVALEHFYIFYLESVATQSDTTSRVFNVDKEELACSSVSSALGDQIAEYAVKNMASRGINYIIWKQRFYAPYDSKYGPAYTWNPMPDRGSVTENHYDHVHVSMN